MKYLCEFVQHSHAWHYSVVLISRDCFLRYSYSFCELLLCETTRTPKFTQSIPHSTIPSSILGQTISVAHDTLTCYQGVTMP